MSMNIILKYGLAYRFVIEYILCCLSYIYIYIYIYILLVVICIGAGVN